MRTQPSRGPARRPGPAQRTPRAARGSLRRGPQGQCPGSAAAPPRRDAAGPARPPPSAGKARSSAAAPAARTVATRPRARGLRGWRDGKASRSGAPRPPSPAGPTYRGRRSFHSLLTGSGGGGRPERRRYQRRQETNRASRTAHAPPPLAAPRAAPAPCACAVRPAERGLGRRERGASCRSVVSCDRDLGHRTDSSQTRGRDGKLTFIVAYSTRRDSNSRSKSGFCQYRRQCWQSSSRFSVKTCRENFPPPRRCLPGARAINNNFKSNLVRLLITKNTTQILGNSSAVRKIQLLPAELFGSHTAEVSLL